MKRTLLIRMKQDDGGLERVIRAVRDSGFRITSMTARLSLDGATYFLTLDVAGESSPVVLKRSVLDVEGVRAVEEDGGIVAVVT